MIRIENIKKSFNGKEVLKGISGTFEKGKPNLIIGASGTGKSVLLKCIVGLIQPDDGFVYYGTTEFSLAPRNDKTEIRRQIGMLFQGGALFDSKTVEQNIMFPLDILTDMPLDEKLDRVNFCLERVGLTGQNKKLPSEISGGMQKRVGIARAIVNSSKYLFCDEPNSGLDPLTSIKIDELIMEITEEYKITTVVVTHDMNSLLGIGENIMFLHEGEKKWEGHKDDIIHSNVKEFEDFVFASKVMRKLK
ncbi:ABC transporter ATP-binding protein [Fulvivirga lutea]|uniref:ATP-binding cassette domain-containing protein n=1 Tax=Fulvivirga lutea TaxID=2810512 RepID=A0A974WH94_9BACT|nr:ATP-binding cassette domain-containing protein [Fulvivirga lutea]QSE97097.1 ATP-binding cassette domain-containing protein [Fulvivirga lutea]